ISPSLVVIKGGQEPNVVVKLKRLQWDERRIQDKIQPVIYDQYQVNLLSAVLLMPKNASYIYDVSTGGIELSYAFEVTATGKAFPPYAKLIRDRVTRQWQTCSNARIQNVFGGVQPANFVANEHMQQTCGSTQALATPDQLRDVVIDALAREIGQIPMR
ncbi:MAG: hypothetical protein HQL40_15115, partial [Alphaproteobacteria bacterium]|nr:hypothetical protein [Alphaproteobacteria bacterium]